MTKNNETHYITQTELKNRGWTTKTILRFVEQPDDTKTNPRYKSASPMKLWSLIRIEEIEGSTDFQEFSLSNRKRREGTERAVQTKRKSLLEQISKISVKVPVFDKDDLIKRACKSYNKQQERFFLERGHWEWHRATNKSDKDFLDRICVNFLRHRCTKYERLLEQAVGKVGVNEAYTEISRKVFTAIRQEYPDLKAECERQMELREDEEDNLKVVSQKRQ